jgi:hypothetical protein
MRIEPGKAQKLYAAPVRSRKVVANCGSRGNRPAGNLATRIHRNRHDDLLRPRLPGWSGSPYASSVRFRSLCAKRAPRHNANAWRRGFREEPQAPWRLIARRNRCTPPTQNRVNAPEGANRQPPNLRGVSLARGASALLCFRCPLSRLTRLRAKRTEADRPVANRPSEACLVAGSVLGNLLGSRHGSGGCKVREERTRSSLEALGAPKRDHEDVAPQKQRDKAPHFDTSGEGA